MRTLASSIMLLLICKMAFGQGIKFEEKLSWEQIKQKARTENKYIFLDIFATWCVPCRQMDREVYANEKVGLDVNDKFISVKVQIDKTPKDNEETRRWYPDAALIEKQYSIEAVPTLLFFTSEGALVHKSTGFQDINAFVGMVEYATDPKSAAFYSDVEKYKKGIKDYSTMLSLLKSVTNLIGDRELAKQIAKDYKENYLDSLDERKLYTKENLDLVSDYYYLVRSTDNLFDLIYHQPAKVDSTMNNKGWSDRVIRYVINKEEIWDRLFTDIKYEKPRSTNPDWQEVFANIKIKYSLHYAEVLVPPAKPLFYKVIKDWSGFAQAREEFIQKYPPNPKTADDFDPKSVWSLNADAWDVFLHCNDRKVLEKALEWSKLTLKFDTISPSDQYLDTKANLLYKLGRTDEAMAIEKKALDITTNGGKNEGSEIYKGILDKMRKGEPTWNVE